MACVMPTQPVVMGLVNQLDQLNKQAGQRNIVTKVGTPGHTW